MARKTQYDFYNDQFKATAVELGALPGIKAKHVAEILTIHPIMLYRWKKELRDGVIMKKESKGTLNAETHSELQRLKKIEKAHERLKQEHGLLKKHPILFGSKKEIFEFIETQRGSYALSLLCRVYSVSRFGYYSWKSRGLSRHSQQDRELSQQIISVPIARSDAQIKSPITYLRKAPHIHVHFFEYMFWST